MLTFPKKQCSWGANSDSGTGGVREAYVVEWEALGGYGV